MLPPLARTNNKIGNKVTFAGPGTQHKHRRGPSHASSIDADFDDASSSSTFSDSVNNKLASSPGLGAGPLSSPSMLSLGKQALTILPKNLSQLSLSPRLLAPPSISFSGAIRPYPLSDSSSSTMRYTVGASQADRKSPFFSLSLPSF